MDANEIAILDGIRQVLELGFPAIVLIMLVVLWGEYRKQVSARIEDLREIAGLKASLAQREVIQKPAPAQDNAE